MTSYNTFKEYIEYANDKITQTSLIDVYDMGETVKCTENYPIPRPFLIKHYVIIKDIIHFEFNKTSSFIHNNGIVMKIIDIIKQYLDLKSIFKYRTTNIEYDVYHKDAIFFEQKVSRFVKDVRLFLDTFEKYIYNKPFGKTNSKCFRDMSPDLFDSISFISKCTHNIPPGIDELLKNIYCIVIPEEDFSNKIPSTFKCELTLVSGCTHKCYTIKYKDIFTTLLDDIYNYLIHILKSELSVTNTYNKECYKHCFPKRIHNCNLLPSPLVNHVELIDNGPNTRKTVNVVEYPL